MSPRAKIVLDSRSEIIIRVGLFLHWLALGARLCVQGLVVKLKKCGDKLGKTGWAPK